MRASEVKMANTSPMALLSLILASSRLKTHQVPREHHARASRERDWVELAKYYNLVLTASNIFLYR